jgi:hypothetical protein
MSRRTPGGRALMRADGMRIFGWDVNSSVDIVPDASEDTIGDESDYEDE